MTRTWIRPRGLVFVGLLIWWLSPCAFGATVTLAWESPTMNADASPLTDLASFNLYRCTGSACTPTLLLNVGLVTTYQDTTIALATIYRYVITALDTSDNESAVSNIIEIGPPPTPTGVQAK